MSLTPSCPDAQVMRQFIRGELSNVQAAAMGQHLRQCPRCVQAMAALRAREQVAVEATSAHQAGPREVTDCFVRAEPVASATFISADTSATDAALTDILAPAQVDGELGRLGKYRVLSVLGRGGMGVVYRAEDPVLKRTVAIKAILPSLGGGEAVRRRFLREARAMAQLEHENVIRLYDVNEDRGVPYLAMEFLSGQSLEARLREQQLPLGEALRIGKETAAGLAAAHQQNLIHRDIKPANVFLSGPAGRVKILDFGLARMDADESRLTQSGAVVGTPAYMAPEQTRGEPVDFRCDLFSLGVVLYRMSTGKLPFEGPDAISTMTAIATEAPVPPKVQEPHLPGDLSTLILRLLDKDPARRGTAQAAVDALDRIQTGKPVEFAGAANPSLGNAANAETWSAIAVDKPAAKPRATAFPWLIVAAVLAAVLLCVAGPLAVIAALLLR